MPQTITLVPCGKAKRDKPAPAGQLYTSPSFALARAYAEHHGRWLILSAKHGVLQPTDLVEPYDETLKGQSQEHRQAWSSSVVADLLALSQPGDTFQVLAGRSYCEFLVDPLRQAGRQVTLLLYGMRMGFRNQWLGQELDRLGVPRPSARAKAGRLQHLQRFYSLLERLGAGTLLPHLQGGKDLPQRGVYFFFEGTENRSDSGDGPRVVRVGTHAVASGSNSTLWRRLKQHMGGRDGAGNHRGSVFRKLLGDSLAQRDPSLAVASWGQGIAASGKVPRLERDLELQVSQQLRAMPILWLDIDDEPSKDSLRSTIERNSIALLSNYHAQDHPLDPHSPGWLGQHCPKPKIRRSHLWNSNHVDETYDPAFLDLLERLITAQLEGRKVEGIRWETPAKVGAPSPRPSRPSDPRSTKSHYDLITDHLQQSGQSGQTTLTATIDEVNTWTDGRLPQSAYKHQAWWSGKRALWTNHGWTASPKLDSGTVTFRRATSAEKSSDRRLPNRQKRQD